MIGRALTAREAAALLDRLCEARPPQMYCRRSEQHRQDNEGAPIDRRHSKHEPQTPPTEPGFDRKRDAADEEQRRQGRVKAEQ